MKALLASGFSLLALGLYVIFLSAIGLGCSVITPSLVSQASPGARLAYDDSADRFDVLPLLVATDGAIAAFGRGGRRLRPNIVVGGVAGLAEPTWPGRRLRIGEVLIGIESLRGRCVITTFDPDTLQQDRQVLRGIVQRFGDSSP